PDLMEKLKKSYGIAEGDEVVLFLGRMEPAKGVIQLMEAIPLIREKHPNVKFLIIGKGILEDRMRQEAERLGSVVRLITELLDQPMKIQHYGIADLCVFPSLYEPFGIEALEAAAMGKPSVVGARGVSGLREIVENRDAPRPTGIHMNGWDPKDIAWGVNMALDDPERLKQWGRNARERCTNDFTWRKAAERTLEIYQEVLAR
ncbi:MAG: glycosyltransferase family 4 protein, partial [Methanothrix sp.]